MVVAVLFMPALKITAISQWSLCITASVTVSQCLSDIITSKYCYKHRNEQVSFCMNCNREYFAPQSRNMNRWFHLVLKNFSSQGVKYALLGSHCVLFTRSSQDLGRVKSTTRSLFYNSFPNPTDCGAIISER